MKKSTLLQQSPDFSRVRRASDQLFRRTRLSGNALELFHRRILAFWGYHVATVVVSLAPGGYALGDAVQSPFYATSSAAPIPGRASGTDCGRVDRPSAIRPVVQRFVERRIVIPDELPKFSAAIDSAKRERYSVAVEVVLTDLVYTVGHGYGSVRSRWATTWYAMLERRPWQFTPAGYWYAFVSIPIFEFFCCAGPATPDLVPLPVADFGLNLCLTPSIRIGPADSLFWETAPTPLSRSSSLRRRSGRK